MGVGAVIYFISSFRSLYSPSYFSLSRVYPQQFIIVVLDILVGARLTPPEGEATHTNRIFSGFFGMEYRLLKGRTEGFNLT